MVVHPFSGYVVASKTGSVRALVIQHTMAVSFKIWVRNLVPKFLAHAAVFLGPGDTAGAVAAGFFQPLLDGLDNFLVLIELDSHVTGLHSMFVQLRFLFDVMLRLYQYRQRSGGVCGNRG